MFDISDLELDRATRNRQYSGLRATPGIPHDEQIDVWYVSRHADVVEVSQAPERFSSAGGVTYFDALPLSFVTMDDPEHGRLRRIVSRQFTPKMVKDLRDRTAQLTNGALDALDDPAEVDFVAGIAAPVTFRIIADMLGLPPADLPGVKSWTDTMMDAGGRLEEPGVADAAAENFITWTTYVAEQVAQRMATPGDDLLSRLAHSEDERLDADELAMFATTLMVAGNETTRHTSTMAIDLLMQHPEQRWRLVADPGLMPAAVEEVLRFTSVARHMVRTVTADTELAGTAIPAGARLVLLYPSANRDEAVFEDPESFLIDRSPNQHLAFGIGSHYCLGANLARMELDVILSTVLSRWPDPAPLGDAGPVYRSNGLVDGVASMMVNLTGK